MPITLIENFRAVFYAPFYATFALDASARCFERVLDHAFWSAVCAHDARLVRKLKTLEQLDRAAHRLPVRIAAHDDADDGIGHADCPLVVRGFEARSIQRST